MAKRSTTELAFSAIRIEGGLLAADFLGRVARFEATGQAEADYDIPKGLKLPTSTRNPGASSANWKKKVSCAKLKFGSRKNLPSGWLTTNPN